MLVSANVKKFITEPNLEIELRPLLLFRGGLTPSRAVTNFNLLRGAMDAQLPTMTAISQSSTVSNDAAHLCGVHRKSEWGRMGMAGFFSRVLQSPSVLNRAPMLKDYIHWVVEQTPNAFVFNLDPIPEMNIWSTRAWRRPQRKRVAPLAECYPYITTAPTEDHDLLLSVERLIPKTLPHEIRGDVCQDMIVAVLTGEVTLDNLRDAPAKYMRQFFKQMPSKYGPLSLDAELDFEGGKGRTIGSRVMAHR